MATVPPYQSKRPLTFITSALHAWEGLIHTVVHQRNMRIHLIAGIMVGLVGSGIPLGLAEKVTLIFCVLLVLFAETLNSALEQLVDLAVQQFDEKARLTKDAAAAGVLVLAIGTMVIFAATMVHNWATIVDHLPEVQRQAMFGVPLTICGGALMHEQRKPLWFDVTLAIAALTLWGLTVSWTTSAVFSAMTFGLLVVTGAAAIKRRTSQRAGPETQQEIS